MDERDVFILADAALLNVVEQIKDDQWTMTMPPEFATRGQASVTLREIINYHAYDEAWVPDILAGKTMEEAGSTKFDGDLLGESPKERFAGLVTLATEAVRAATDLDKTAHLSYGDFPVREYLWHITSFRGLRAYDLAKVIGIDPTLPADLVQGLWDELSPHAEEWRAMGIFGPEVKVGEDADLQTKLLGMTGRQL